MVTRRCLASRSIARLTLGLSVEIKTTGDDKANARGRRAVVFGTVISLKLVGGGVGTRAFVPV